MDQIIPRWEWRTFGQEFGPAERHFASLLVENVQHSKEVYLVSTLTDANVKIRDELLDIKILERVDAHGLEQWRPALKAPFPIDASTVRTTREALGLTELLISPTALALEELLSELAGAGSPVRVVHVSKTRTRYRIEGCTAELTEVIADGTEVRTVAVEDVDPDKVIAAVRAMELERYPNVSYPRGLKQLLGLSIRGRPAMIRQAVIDVGTNSIKFHVAELRQDGIWQSLVDRAEVTRLGEGIQETGAIAPAAIERTAAALKGMADEAARLRADGVTAVGTMGLRTASNSRAFVDLVKERTGVTIEVISGEQERRLAYMAVKSALGLATGPLVVFDTGGGSSQFTIGQGDRVDRQFSVNVGAVRYTEKYHLARAVSEEVLKQALEEIASDLAALDGVAPPDALVGMGGAVTNMTAVMHGLAQYDPDKVQGSVMDRQEVGRQIERYRALPAEARRDIVGLQPKRAEVILAGACIVATVMDKLKQEALSVSDRGLRHGVLIDHFGGRLARAQ